MPSACKQRKCRLAAAENGVGARTGAIHIREAIACMKTDRAFAKAAVRGVVASLVGAILCFTASASAQEPLKLADSQLEPVKWTELASWRTDDHLAAFAAYRTSCQALRKVPRTDDHRPIHEALGQVHDSQVVEEVLNTPRPPLVVTADKAYDSQTARQQIKDEGALPIIPNRRNAIKQAYCPKRFYRQRHKIENFFCRIKDWRRIATRYDKLARNFLAAATLIGALYWIKL